MLRRIMEWIQDRVNLDRSLERLAERTQQTNTVREAPFLPEPEVQTQEDCPILELNVALQTHGTIPDWWKARWRVEAVEGESALDVAWREARHGAAMCRLLSLAGHPSTRAARAIAWSTFRSYGLGFTMGLPPGGDGFAPGILALIPSPPTEEALLEGIRKGRQNLPLCPLGQFMQAMQQGDEAMENWCESVSAYNRDPFVFVWENARSAWIMDFMIEWMWDGGYVECDRVLREVEVMLGPRFRGVWEDGMWQGATEEECADCIRQVAGRPPIYAQVWARREILRQEWLNPDYF